MTGRELILWILENNAEDHKIEVQYRDSDQDFPGTDDTLYLNFEVKQDQDGWNYQCIVL